VDTLRSLGVKLSGAVINAVGIDDRGGAYGFGYGYGYGSEHGYGYGDGDRQNDGDETAAEEEAGSVVPITGARGRLAGGRSSDTRAA
jgi:hypothetical protein